MKYFVYLFMLFTAEVFLCAGAQAQGFSKEYDNGNLSLTFIRFHDDGMGEYETASEYFNEDGERMPYSCSFTYDYYWNDGLPFVKITSGPIPYYNHRYDTMLLLSGTQIGNDRMDNIAFGWTVPVNEEKTRLVLNEHPRIFERTYWNIYDCSSFLVERTTSYPVKNLTSRNDSTPWVEGVPGVGIGEGFTIERDIDRSYLLIMNGYISYNKPYLYKQNARVKKIRVTGTKSGISRVLDVIDTPNPQTVDITSLDENDDARVTIEDVYPGTKYEDTCISLCVTYRYKVVPDDFLRD